MASTRNVDRPASGQHRREGGKTGITSTSELQCWKEQFSLIASVKSLAPLQAWERWQAICTSAGGVAEVDTEAMVEGERESTASFLGPVRGLMTHRLVEGRHARGGARGDGHPPGIRALLRDTTRAFKCTEALPGRERVSATGGGKGGSRASVG